MEFLEETFCMGVGSPTVHELATIKNTIVRLFAMSELEAAKEDLSVRIATTAGRSYLIPTTASGCVIPALLAN